jgi:hypothetical protein
VQYKKINKPPHNENEYELVAASTNQEIIEAQLMEMLRQNKPLFRTGTVPLDWATHAVEFALKNNHAVRTLTCDDSADPGVAMSQSGTFYFRRRQFDKTRHGWY